MSGASPRRETLFVPGPAGPLEALLEYPAAQPVAGLAVVCHPHPQQQGTMRNKVVHTLARALNELGFAALRFNFRGTGASAGSWDGGRGEADDVAAASDYLCTREPALPLWLAGFSFGGAMAARVAAAGDVARLVTVAPPPGLLGPEMLPRLPACPWLLVQGEDDDVVPAADQRRWLAERQAAVELVTMAGVGHFFHGRLAELRGVLTSRLAMAAGAA